jgi:ribosomal 50S subunit-associated protein YjgA (DUF615 family)
VVRKARQAHLQVRQRLLEELMKIPEHERASLPLTEALLDGLAELGRTKRGTGRRRLARYLARRVDDEEWAPVELALAARSQSSAAVVAAEKVCVTLRNHLVDEGVVALDLVWARFPHADRDGLESLTRTAHGMPHAAKGRKARRALLRALRNLAQLAP